MTRPTTRPQTPGLHRTTAPRRAMTTTPPTYGRAMSSPGSAGPACKPSGALVCPALPGWTMPVCAPTLTSGACPVQIEKTCSGVSVRLNAQPLMAGLLLQSARNSGHQDDYVCGNSNQRMAGHSTATPSAAMATSTKAAQIDPVSNRKTDKNNTASTRRMIPIVTIVAFSRKQCNGIQ